LAPILVIAIAVAGSLFGDDAAQGKVVEVTQEYLGTAGAQVFERLLENAKSPGAGLNALLGVVGLFFSASLAFVELQTALNTFWKVRKEPGGPIRGFILLRLRSFVLVLATGLLLT